MFLAILAVVAGLGVVYWGHLKLKDMASETGKSPGIADKPSIREIVDLEAADAGIPASLVMAVIDKESNFDRLARGGKGEIGLMQILPGALADYNREKKTHYIMVDLYSASLNIKVGTWYLGWLWHHFNLPTDTAVLQAYNGGIGNYQKGSVSSEAKAYAEDVLKRELRYA